MKQIIESTEDEKVRSDLQVVHKNASRLLGLVYQLLDISKLESGTMTLRAVPQNIVPLLRGLALSFASYAERKRITLTFSAVEDDIRAYFDKDKVEKIVTNILSNTFKFTPEGGTKDAGQLSLDFLDLQVDSVHVGAMPAKYRRQPSSIELFLDGSDPTRPDTVLVTVWYGGEVQDGLIIHTDRQGRWAAFGDNWPDRARRWLPTIDRPDAKATVSWSVIGPADRNVVANGQFV